MAGATIYVENIERVQQMLNKLKDIPEFFDPGMDEALKKLQEQRLDGIANYAPEKPGQAYVRTGNLGNSWYLQRYGQSVYRFGNDASGDEGSYAGRVVGDSQHPEFAGRWWIATERITYYIPDVVKDLIAYLIKNIE